MDSLQHCGVALVLREELLQGCETVRMQDDSLPAAAVGGGGKETGSGPLTLQPGPDGIGVPPGLGVQGLQLLSGR